MIRLLNIENRQYLMGIAILLVVLHHLAIYGAGRFFYIFEPGRIGVDIFFFLSSYGCCYSMEKYNLWSFYKRRFQRLFPIYAVFLLCVLAIFYHENSIWERLITFFTHISGYAVFTEERLIAWYIPATIVLYLFFPLAYRLLLLIKDYYWIQIVALAFLMLFSYKFPIIMNLGLALRLPIIFLGMLTYLHIKENKPKMLLLYVFVIVISFFVKQHFIIAASVVIPLLLYGLGESDFNFPLKPIVNFLGKYSLEIYLGQNIAIETMMRRGLFDSMTNKLTIRVIVALLLSALFSYLLYAVQKNFWKLFLKTKE